MRKQFCERKGHDTFKHGRSPNGRCRLCKMETDREYSRSEAGKASSERKQAREQAKRRAAGKCRVEIPHLKKVRIELGLSQKRLAEEAGLHPAIIWKGERSGVLHYKTVEKIHRTVTRIQKQKAAAARRRGPLAA